MALNQVDTSVSEWLQNLRSMLDEGNAKRTKLQETMVQVHEGTLRRTREWHSCLTAQLAEVRGRCDATAEDLAGLALTITEEVTECRT